MSKKTTADKLGMPSGKNSPGKGHPLLFGKEEAEMYDSFPEGGGYPKRFLQLAFEDLGVTAPDEVLHLCAGSMKVGVTVDIRPETEPEVVADCRDTPFKDESFRWIMADPPYSKEYAENLYSTGDSYPKPYSIVKEATRLLEPGGRFGLLHHKVPVFRKPLKLLKVRGITTGLGYNIRAWTVFEKGGTDG